MSYWEIRDKLHQLMVRTIEFDAGLKSDEPNWDALWDHHLELCRIEEYLRIRENR